MRVVVLLLAVVVLAGGCTSSPISAPRADQSLVVHLYRPLSVINYPFWGVNYVGFWDPIQGSTASMQAMKNAGVEVLRFPGGEPANWLDWAAPTDPPAWSLTSTDELASYAAGVGAELLLQTNPTTNPIDDAGTRNDPDPAHVAGWVQYVLERNILVRFWEIGNEPDLGLTVAGDRDGLQWYIDAFHAQATAMKAVNPEIMVLGPVSTNSYFWWRLGTLAMFLEQAGDRYGSGMVDGISLHYYPAQGCVEWNAVRGAGQGWATNMEYITQTIARYDTRDLPVFISETNAAVGELYCPINKTMAAALANADLFGAYRASGVQAVQWFGTIHAADGWGMLYGSAEDRPAETPTPSYFILPIWTRSGDTVLAVSGMSDAEKVLSAYASQGEDGGVQVVLINKGAAPLQVEITLQGFNGAAHSVDVYELRPAHGEITDRDVIYNGVMMPDVTADQLPPPAVVVIDGPSFTHQVAGYSLTLLDVQP